MSRVLKPNVVAIITGASTGIGRALVLQLARDFKARMVITARTQADLDEVAASATQLGGEVATVCGDIAERATISALMETCRSKFETPDVLINNAGFAKPGLMERLSVDDWRRVFEVNFFSSLEMTYAVLPEFLSRKQGLIVNIASVAGKVAFPGSVCYASSKFALTGFSEGMAAELGPKGIDVITVCPGLVRTAFFRKNQNSKDFTAMAEEPNFAGWVLKNVISISSEEAADHIIRACKRGGCQEIVLTGPGKFIERLNGICPPVAWHLSRLVPADRGPKPPANDR